MSQENCAKSCHVHNFLPNWGLLMLQGPVPQWKRAAPVPSVPSVPQCTPAKGESLVPRSVSHRGFPTPPMISNTVLAVLGTTFWCWCCQDPTEFFIYIQSLSTYLSQLWEFQILKYSYTYIQKVVERISRRNRKEIFSCFFIFVVLTHMRNWLYCG